MKAYMLLSFDTEDLREADHIACAVAEGICDGVVELVTPTDPTAAPDPWPNLAPFHFDVG